MINIKKVTLYLGISLSSFILKAQNDPTAIIYDYAYKNIVTYNLNIELKRNKSISNGFIYTPFFIYYLPDKGYNMDMKVEKLDLKYPIPNVILYKVFLEGFSFTNEKLGITKKSNIYAPTGSYLVGFNEVDKSIKFISGNFFCTPIADDFKLNKNDPKSYLNFIALKFFSWDLSNIVFKRKSRNTFFFDAYSQNADKKVIIELSVRNVEEPRFTNSN